MDGLTLGQRLGLLRGDSISQQDVADAIGVKRSTVRNWELDQREIKPEMLCKLADYFGVTTDYLLGRTSYKTLDKDLQVACETLGLSDKAVSNIQQLTATFKPSHYISSVERFFASDSCFRFFNAMEDVALEAFVLSEETKSLPYLGDWRKEQHRADPLKLAIYNVVKVTESEVIKLYDAEKILERAKASAYQALISNAQQQEPEAADGQEAKV